MPNSPPRSSANRPLQDTKVKLKAETDVKHDISSAEEGQTSEVIPEQNCLNAGASTSSATTPHSDQNMVPEKQVYYHPVRERIKRAKRIFESSSSSDISSSDYQYSDDSWQLQTSPKREKKYTKSIKIRRKKSMIMKKSALKSESHKLAILPISRKSKEDETSEEHPRIRKHTVKSTND